MATVINQPSFVPELSLLLSGIGTIQNWRTSSKYKNYVNKALSGYDEAVMEGLTPEEQKGKQWEVIRDIEAAGAGVSPGQRIDTANLFPGLIKRPRFSYEEKLALIEAREAAKGQGKKANERLAYIKALDKFYSDNIIFNPEKAEQASLLRDELYKNIGKGITKNDRKLARQIMSGKTPVKKVDTKTIFKDSAGNLFKYKSNGKPYQVDKKGKPI